MSDFYSIFFSFILFPSAPEDENRKQLLDLIIVSTDLEKNIESFVIDSDKKFTPFRSRKNKSPVFPDHYALLLKLKNIPCQCMNFRGRQRSIHPVLHNN